METRLSIRKSKDGKWAIFSVWEPGPKPVTLGKYIMSVEDLKEKFLQMNVDFHLKEAKDRPQQVGK